MLHATEVNGRPSTTGEETQHAVTAAAHNTYASILASLESLHVLLFKNPRQALQELMRACGLTHQAAAGPVGWHARPLLFWVVRRPSMLRSMLPVWAAAAAVHRPGCASMR